MVSFPQVSTPKNVYAPRLSPIRATYHTHLILFHLTARIIFGKEYVSQTSPAYSILHSPVTSSLLGPNTFHRKLRTLPAYVPPSMRETKFHTHTKLQTCWKRKDSAPNDSKDPLTFNLLLISSRIQFLIC
jgi:hypothetical protein